MTRLSEAELLLVRAWVDEEIRLARRPGLRLVRGPEALARRTHPTFDGEFVELAGAVRRLLHELPEDRLLVLDLWVWERLQSRFGYSR